MSSEPKGNKRTQDITVATRMATIGCLDELQVGTEDFDCYIERMEQYFIANDVPEAKKVATFLSAIGAKAYELLHNLVAPDSPKDKRFNDLVKTLRAHLKPKPLVITERFKFHKRMQQQEESVAEYIVTLKHLATHCDFGTFLNDALRNQLVVGLSQDSTQRKLLTEDKLTFKKACEIAQAMELAEKNTCELKAAGSSEVQAVSEQHKSVKKSLISLQVQDPSKVVTGVEDNTKRRFAGFVQRNVEGVASLAI